MYFNSLLPSFKKYASSSSGVEELLTAVEIRFGKNIYEVIKRVSKPRSPYVMFVVTANWFLKYSKKSSSKQGIYKIKLIMKPLHPSILERCLFKARNKIIKGIMEIRLSKIYPVVPVYMVS